MFALVTLLTGRILLGVLAVAALLWGELEHWRASRRRMGAKPGESGTGASWRNMRA
jgi:hypothetical protein